MGISRYVAYNAENHEFELFKTIGEAEKWLLDGSEDDDGIPESFCNGEWGIYELAAVSSFEKTEFREDYCECDPDGECVCDKEEWPYSSDWKYAGRSGIEPVPRTNAYMARIIELEKWIGSACDEFTNDDRDDMDEDGRALLTKQWMGDC